MADFIITSLQSWDIGIGSTIKNTALEISKKDRVFYINTPSTFPNWLHSPMRKNDLFVNANFQVIYCNFPALPANSMPSKCLFDIVNYYNNYRIALTIKTAIQRYKIQDFILLIDTDLFRSRYLKQLLHPAISVYYRRDYVIGVNYWQKYGPVCEQFIVKESDIVLTNSSYFTEELRPFNHNIHTTNTGVNLQLYDASMVHDVPKDLESIPAPRIGYTGAIIQSRLDAELLYTIIQQLPQYSFVFVGPEDEYFAHHPLHTLRNVYFTGKKVVAELPAYIQHFNICINPQLVNPITEGNYPLKIDEYLAMGKPVVSTSTHTMRDVFAQYVHLATDTNSYLCAIQEALNEINDNNLKAERIAFAHTHSWAHSVEKIYAAIEEFQRNTKNKCHEAIKNKRKD
ncbi:glycosyltransferase [Bacteroides sp. GD17]|jgi:teichuronic acid biosynthesis glycosyltransferase TuaH|uniref:glycosyltransferase n=1 Tax=Bacteroides sp. GD17 TaxID=3139826 RepID=UPI0025D353F1|nr:glycosyltransferase [uncultured Bacteroides sp.]